MAMTAEAVADKEATIEQREKLTTRTHEGNVTVFRAIQNHVRNQTKEKRKRCIHTFGAKQRELEELTK